PPGPRGKLRALLGPGERLRAPLGRTRALLVLVEEVGTQVPPHVANVVGVNGEDYRVATNGGYVADRHVQGAAIRALEIEIALALAGHGLAPGELVGVVCLRALDQARAGRAPGLARADVCPDHQNLPDGYAAVVFHALAGAQPAISALSRHVHLP